MSWEPVAKHGDSEDEVRRALWCAFESMLNDWRRKLRAQGVLLEEIESLARISRERQAVQIERDLPNYMKRMALGAGAVSVH